MFRSIEKKNKLLPIHHLIMFLLKTVSPNYHSVQSFLITSFELDGGEVMNAPHTGKTVSSARDHVIFPCINISRRRLQRVQET